MTNKDLLNKSLEQAIRHLEDAIGLLGSDYHLTQAANAVDYVLTDPAVKGE